MPDGSGLRRPYGSGGVPDSLDCTGRERASKGLARGGGRTRDKRRSATSSGAGERGDEPLGGRAGRVDGSREAGGVCDAPAAGGEGRGRAVGRSWGGRGGGRVVREGGSVAAGRTAGGSSTGAGAFGEAVPSSSSYLRKSDVSSRLGHRRSARERWTHPSSFILKPYLPAHRMTASHRPCHASSSRALSISSRTTTLRCVLDADVESSASEKATVIRGGESSGAGWSMSASARGGASAHVQRHSQRERERLGRTVDLVHLGRLEAKHGPLLRDDDERARRLAQNERALERVLLPVLVHDDAPLDGELEVVRVGQRERGARDGRRVG